MDSLKDTDWDVLISGTGLKQSLLALSLSRSNLRVLHTDAKPYYGGSEAALSLEEADAWCKNTSSTASGMQKGFSNASITIYGVDEQGGIKLGPSRAYNLALAPQVLYTQCSLLPLLVSSGVHEQLEFLAVGSWWVYESSRETDIDGQIRRGRLSRVPSSREDIFSNSQLPIRHKRALVKFLRFIIDYRSEENLATWESHATGPFLDFLSSQFNIPEMLHAALLSLTMTRKRSKDVSTEEALNAIYRHLTSMNVFGPGFAAVSPKYGGLSEISQVGCRALAVGGGVYVLNQAIEAVEKTDSLVESGSLPAKQQSEEVRWNVTISGGESVPARFIVGSQDDMLGQQAAHPAADVYEDVAETVAHSIFVVSSSLPFLFPEVVEGAPPPAGAVVVFPGASLGLSEDKVARVVELPAYVLVHSSDTGECPAGQCVVYSSIALPDSGEQTVQAAFEILRDAVQQLLIAVDSEDPGRKPNLLWSMQYTQRSSRLLTPLKVTDNAMQFSPLSSAIALEDDTIDEVKEAWKTIIGPDADVSQFLKFARRRTGDDDDD